MQLTTGFVLVHILVLCTSLGIARDMGLEISVVHFNDFHARFEEVSSTSGLCKPAEGMCHGGFARLYTAIMQLKKRNSILLNAGDLFQGTPYYNIFKWNITKKFVNMLPMTAHTLGNHEFDDSLKGVIPLLKTLRAPVVVANINDTLEPSFQGLYKKSIIVKVRGKKIGIVGAIVKSANTLSNTEQLQFLDEITSINNEAEYLVKHKGVFTVIVVTHCGYDVDQLIAKKLIKRVAVIVGGHSHSFLYTGASPDGSNPLGPYPTIIKRDLDGKDVLVVQASAYTRYLGNIHVTYDHQGEVIDWSGEPVYLGPEVEQDARILKLLQPYKDAVDKVGNEVLGSTEVLLSDSCFTSECNFGNFLADSLVYSFKNRSAPGCWAYAALGVVNAGGIRSSIPIGNITLYQLMAAQPFENKYDVGLLQGKYIRESFEYAATPPPSNPTYPNGYLLQVSGFKVVIDRSKPIGGRVVSVKVRSECSTDYEDLDDEKTYRIAFTTFLRKGGDGFAAFADKVTDFEEGEIDIDVLKRYIGQESPIQIGIEGRLVFQ